MVIRNPPASGSPSVELRQLERTDLESWWAYSTLLGARYRNGRRAVTEWSFANLRYIRVQAVVLETNRASERVLQKALFQYEGPLRWFRMVRGRPSNFKMYARIAAP